MNTGTGRLRFAAGVAVCVVLGANLVACTGGGEDSAEDERQPEEAAKAESVFPDKEQWSKEKDELSSLPEGDALEAIVALVEDAGAAVHYVDHPACSRAAPMGPLSSCGWAPAAATHRATATPSWMLS